MILTLDCQGSAELTSESFDRQLHWAERIAVKLHCMICAKSRRLNHQLTDLNKKLDEVMIEQKSDQSLSLSSDARNRIAQKLRAIRDELD